MTSRSRMAFGLLLGEALACELADRLEHREPARLARARGSCRRARRASPGRTRRPLRPLRASSRRRTPPGARTSSCSCRLEQVVAPGDRRAQRLLSLRASRAPPVRSGSRCSSRASRASGGSDLHARRRQLDRERQAVEAAADLGDRAVGREVGADGAGSLVKRATASSSGNGGTGYCCSSVRRSGSRLVASSLRLLEAGDELGEARRAAEDLLHVVEQQQRPAVAQVAGEIGPCAPTVCAIVGSTRSESWISWSADPPDVLELVRGLGGELQRETRLPGCRAGRRASAGAARAAARPPRPAPARGRRAASPAPAGSSSRAS